MKKGKTIGICILILFTAGIISAAGQGESPDTADNQVTLTAMYGSADWPELNDKLVNDFMLENTNIKVEYTPVAAGDFTALIQAKIAADMLPDVIAINPDAFGAKLAEEGWLADLSDTETARNEIDAVKGPFTTSDGEILFGVPIGYATCFMYYNKSMFAEAGIMDSEIPTDWDSFLALSKKLQNAGMTPLITSANMIANTYFSFPFAQNVIPSDPDWRQKMIGGAFNFETPEIMDIFSKWQELADYFQDGAISTDYGTMNQLFLQGKGAMVFMGSWGASELSDSQTNGFETGSFLAPFNDTGESTAIAVAPETGFAVSAKSTHVNEAKDFLDWLLFDKYADIQNARGSIPHLKSCDNVSLHQTVLDVLPAMQESFIGGELYFTYMPMTLSEEPITKFWQAIMLGETDPQKAAADMQTLYNQAF